MFPLLQQNIKIQVCTDSWRRAQVQQQEAEMGSAKANGLFTNNIVSTTIATRNPSKSQNLILTNKQVVDNSDLR